MMQRAGGRLVCAGVAVVLWAASAVFGLEASHMVRVTIDGQEAILDVFSEEKLAKYDGTQAGEPIYLAVKGVVFDVTESAAFYGKGGDYHALAGRDCSRALAMNKIDRTLGESLNELTTEELERLENMYNNVYKEKYEVVGITKKRVPKWDKEL